MSPALSDLELEDENEDMSEDLVVDDLHDFLNEAQQTLAETQTKVRPLPSRRSQFASTDDWFTARRRRRVKQRVCSFDASDI
jgi:hypothetical protein